jgi:dolichol kinase
MRGTELARKAIHLTTAAVPIALARGVSQDHVTTAVAACFAIACVLEVFRRTSQRVDALFRRLVGELLRSHEVESRLTGAFWLLGALLLACLLLDTRDAIAVTWAASVGDASAALAGRAWRAWSPGEGKTWVGSAALMLTTVLGAAWLAKLGWPAALLVGVAAMVAERPAVALDDNVRVAGGAAIAMRVVHALGWA